MAPIGRLCRGSHRAKWLCREPACAVEKMYRGTNAAAEQPYRKTAACWGLTLNPGDLSSELGQPELCFGTKHICSISLVSSTRLLKGHPLIPYHIIFTELNMYYDTVASCLHTAIIMQTFLYCLFILWTSFNYQLLSTLGSLSSTLAFISHLLTCLVLQ